MKLSGPGTSNGLNHVHDGVRCPGGAVPIADLDQGHDREDQQHRDLDAEQHLLEVGRDLDPDVADRGHGDDPPDPDQEHPAAVDVARDAVRAEELEEVVGGDLGQAGHHQDVGHDDPPAAPPPGLRAEGAGAPGERRAAVGVRAVERLVAEGDQQHGDEGADRDDRRLQAPDGDDDEPEGRRQAVGRGRGGHPDHHRGDTKPRAPPFSPLSVPSSCSASEASRCTTGTPSSSKEWLCTLLKRAPEFPEFLLISSVGREIHHLFMGKIPLPLPDFVATSAVARSARCPPAASAGWTTGASRRASGSRRPPRRSRTG